MELPRDIVQIGETNPNCKVYVEDYAVSFLKQQNRQAVDKGITVALFGKNRAEEDKTYVFVYGAAIIKSLQKESRHLSQAQYQEIEKLRRRYFADYELVGYRILNGEMIEGMHICEKDTFRYIAGYAQFYEKNDIMLAYMLEYKGGDAQPEVVDQEKYEMVKKRQEERRSLNDGNRKKNGKEEERHIEDHGEVSTGISTQERDELKETWSGVLKKQRQGLRRLQVATVAVFAVLCVVGLYSLGHPEEQEGMAEEIPVAGPAQIQSPDNLSILRTDEKLTEALIEENRDHEEQNGEDNPRIEADVSKEYEDSIEESNEDMPETDGKGAQGDEGTDSRESEAMPAESGEEQQGSESQVSSAQAEPTEYVIRKGDTLLGISLRVYGNTSMVLELCRENNIVNPDDIKVGQKIRLP